MMLWGSRLTCALTFWARLLKPSLAGSSRSARKERPPIPTEPT